MPSEYIQAIIKIARGTDRTVEIINVDIEPGFLFELHNELSENNGANVYPTAKQDVVGSNCLYFHVVIEAARGEPILLRIFDYQWGPYTEFKIGDFLYEYISHN